MICSVYKSCVVCLVETWLDSSIDDVEISVQGYNVIRLDCSRHGGGMLIYVSTCFSHSILFKGSPEFEFIVISLFNCKYTPQDPDFYLALFYRPPNTSISLLDTLFSTLCNLNPIIFVSLVTLILIFLSPPICMISLCQSCLHSSYLKSYPSLPELIIHHPSLT